MADYNPADKTDEKQSRWKQLQKQARDRLRRIINNG